MDYCRVHQQEQFTKWEVETPEAVGKDPGGQKDKSNQYVRKEGGKDIFFWQQRGLEPAKSALSIKH